MGQSPGFFSRRHHMTALKKPETFLGDIVMGWCALFINAMPSSNRREQNIKLLNYHTVTHIVIHGKHAATERSLALILNCPPLGPIFDDLDTWREMEF